MLLPLSATAAKGALPRRGVLVTIITRMSNGRDCSEYRNRNPMLQSASRRVIATSRLRSACALFTHQAHPSNAGATKRPASRSRGPGGENMATMSAAVTHVEQLERILLRRGLGALTADRTSCADCGRTPLTGEHVHLYGGRSERIVCELCRAAPSRGADRQRARAPLRARAHCAADRARRLRTRAARRPAPGREPRRPIDLRSPWTP